MGELIAVCGHGMPSPASCVECMEDGPVGPPARVVEAIDAGPFTARYPGDCSGCGLGIHEGQRIVHTTADRWRHAACSGELPYA